MGDNALRKGCSWAETVRVLKEVVARYGQKRMEWEMRPILCCRFHVSRTKPVGGHAGITSAKQHRQSRRLACCLLPSTNEIIIRVWSRNSSTLSNTYGLLTVSMALTGLVMSSPKKSNNTACSHRGLFTHDELRDNSRARGQEKKKSRSPVSARLHVVQRFILRI